MKRNEMLEVLKETLRNTELNAWASCEACSFLEDLINRDAPKILNALEKAGMLPPECSNPKLEYHEGSGKQLLMLKVHKWDADE